jgi:serine/threonine protein kinase
MDGQVLAGQPGDPRRLGPYELVGRLGQGGMGVVFLGRERRGGRLAAVKALRPELAGDPAFAARFRREVEAARRIDSPQVARVLDADPAAERPWLATEYVDGTTLAAEVAAGGPLKGESLAGFATGVALALAAIHAAGVVHRDLKPANVLLPRPGPGVKVIDFGIAWAADATRTRSGLRVGTPSWMAPEQLRDLPAGPPADMFAWGMLVAFAATGRHPFGGGPAEAVAYRILHDRPDLGGVPGSLRPLDEAALSPDPAARPPASRVAATLAAAASPTLPLPPPAPVPGAPRRRRAGRLLAAAALLAGLATTPQVVLAAVGGSDGASSHQRHANRQCADKEEDRDDAAEAREEALEAAEEAGDEAAEEAEANAEAGANVGLAEDGQENRPSGPAGGHHEPSHPSSGPRSATRRSAPGGQPPAPGTPSPDPGDPVLGS